MKEESKKERNRKNVRSHVKQAKMSEQARQASLTHKSSIVEWRPLRAVLSLHTSSLQQEEREHLNVAIVRSMM